MRDAVAVGIEDLERALGRACARHGTVGAQAALLCRGQMLRAVSGVTSVETGHAVTHDTLFQIGSATKLLGATLTMTMVDRGDLDLDRPVREYVRDVRLPEPALSRLTLRHLLSMQSGLDNGPYSDHGCDGGALARYVRSLAAVPVTAPPGTVFSYSNAGACLAALVVERTAGEPWHDALRGRVLEPAGMARTAGRYEELVLQSLAVGHQVTGDGVEVIRPWGGSFALAPSGSMMCSTASDLVRLAAQLMRSATGGGWLLSEAGAAEMHRVQTAVPPVGIASWWCLGFYRSSWSGRFVHGVPGMTRSGAAQLVWVPELDVAMAVMVNTPAHGYPLAEALFDEVLTPHFGVSRPRPPERTSLPPPALDRLAGVYRSFGFETAVLRSDDRLRARMSKVADAEGPGWTTEVDLVPMSDGSFLPAGAPALGGRTMRFAFVGAEGASRPTHLQSGWWALRRADGDRP